MKWHYTTIQFEALRELGLSAVEYIISDLVYHQTKSGTQWWAYSPRDIGELIGLDEATIRRAVSRCIEKKTLLKEGDKVITRQEFIDMVYPPSGRNASPSGRNARFEVGETPAYYNNISKKVTGATRVELVEEKEIHSNPEKKEKKYPHAKEVFSWFPRPEPSWRLNTTELTHAELLWERGKEKVKGALSFVAKHKGEPYLPKITKPSDLERKWNDLVEYKP